MGQEDWMTKPDDYLKRQYGDLYRAVVGEDRIWNLATRHKPRHRTLFEVFDYSDEELAVCLPPRTARRLLREHPGTFTVSQDADDGMILRFDEVKLHELADVLKLRRKRSAKPLTPERRAKLVEAGRRFRFATGRQSKQTAPDRAISG